MITLHRLHDNGSIVVNADLIETLEATPDTIVTLVTKKRLVVADPLEDIVQAVVDYHARIRSAQLSAGLATSDDVTAGARAARVVNSANDQDKAA